MQFNVYKKIGNKKIEIVSYENSSMGEKLVKEMTKMLNEDSDYMTDNPIFIYQLEEF